MIIMMEKKLIFRINDNGLGPELLQHVFLEKGWIEHKPQVHGENGWNIWWRTSRFRTSEYNSLLPCQWINHHPNCVTITKKDVLCRNLKKMRVVHGTSVYNFSPLAFNLPNDYTKFVSEYAKLKLKENKSSPIMWICKPAESSRGRGIFLFKELSELQYDCKAVVQQYISDPLLIGGYKFDIRVYVAVPSFEPLQIYVHEEGLVRFSTEKYDLDRPDNVFAHLTNTSINKYSPGYTTDKEKVGHGCKWTISQLRQYFQQNSIDGAFIWHRIPNIIILTLLMQAPVVPPVRNCFELYGFDILIDSSLKPWLLEVNFSPSLGSDCQADVIAKKAMLHDLMNIVCSPEAEPPHHLDISRTSTICSGKQHMTHSLGCRDATLLSSRSVSSAWSENATLPTCRIASHPHVLPFISVSSKQNRAWQQKARHQSKLLHREKISNQTKSLTSTVHVTRGTIQQTEPVNTQDRHKEETDDVTVDRTKNGNLYSHLAISPAIKPDEVSEQQMLGNIPFVEHKASTELDSCASGMSDYNINSNNADKNKVISKLTTETEYWERLFRENDMENVKSQANKWERTSAVPEQNELIHGKKGSFTTIGHLSSSNRSTTNFKKQRHVKHLRDFSSSDKRCSNINRLIHFNESERRYSSMTGTNVKQHLCRTARRKMGKFFLVFPFSAITEQISLNKLDVKNIIREIKKETKELETVLKSGISVLADDTGARIWSPIHHNDT